MKNLKTLTLEWPVDGTDLKGRAQLNYLTDIRGTAIWNLPTIEVEFAETESFELNGRTISVNLYRAIIGGVAGKYIGSLSDSVILALDELYGLSGRGYKVRMVAARK